MKERAEIYPVYTHEVAASERALSEGARAEALYLHALNEAAVDEWQRIGMGLDL